jgi:hypothetical protein
VYFVRRKADFPAKNRKGRLPGRNELLPLEQACSMTENKSKKYLSLYIAKPTMCYEGDTNVVWTVWYILSVFINKSDNPSGTYTLTKTPTPKTSIIYGFTEECFELN